MALSGVFMSDTDGNIGSSSITSTEKVTAYYLTFPSRPISSLQGLDLR